MNSPSFGGISRLPGGLGHLADSNSIPWNFTSIFPFNPNCNNTADVPSFVPRTARPAIPLVSDR